MALWPPRYATALKASLAPRWLVASGYAHDMPERLRIARAFLFCYRCDLVLIVYHGSTLVLACCKANH